MKKYRTPKPTENHPFKVIHRLQFFKGIQNHFARANNGDRTRKTRRSPDFKSGAYAKFRHARIQRHQKANQMPLMTIK